VAILTAAFAPMGAFAAASQATIFNFDVGPEGARPRAGFIMDKAGALYGTTSAGGNTGDCFRVPGCGVVFKMTPPAAGQTLATESVLYTFTGGNDGSAPYGGLLMDGSGALYGTTSQGGANGYGVVFKLTPPGAGASVWTDTTLFSFSGGRDGGSPLCALVQDKAGALYGTTQAGGAFGMGVVFRLMPPKNGGTVWRETVLHQFHGHADGGAPVAGLAIDDRGTLYGSTPGFGAHGFGVAFSLTPPVAGKTIWHQTILHAFTNGRDGSYPQGSFILNKEGALFGTTSNMGANATGVGVVFKLSPPSGLHVRWSDRVLFDFNGFLSTASHPVGPLVRDSSGALYGTSVAGGAGQMGVLFKLTRPAGGAGPWTESEPDQFFGNGNDGAQPMGGVMVDKAGTLFGTTYVGGKYFYGAVFEVMQ
jgi:uncharacterized repeat protein (TIGR03803 family)